MHVPRVNQKVNLWKPSNFQTISVQFMEARPGQGSIKLLESMITSRIGTSNLYCCPLCATELTTNEIGGRERLVCAACEFVHWDNPKPVTATVVPMGSGLVLVKRKFPPYVDDWCLPGGFIETMEDPAQSAIREVEEETGLSVEIDRLLGAFSPGKGINVIILFYLAKPATGDMVPGDDASDVGCFQEKDLPKNIAFELHRRMIRDWFDRKLTADPVRL
jgi:8-oxo-dGTP diphosphatase